jgi:hypothetical protein
VEFCWGSGCGVLLGEPPRSSAVAEGAAEEFCCSWGSRRGILLQLVSTLPHPFKRITLVPCVYIFFCFVEGAAGEAAGSVSWGSECGALLGERVWSSAGGAGVEFCWGSGCGVLLGERVWSSAGEAVEGEKLCG